MSLRSIDVRSAVDGSPLVLEIVTREAITSTSDSVTLEALNDDGEKIQAAITTEDSRSMTITLYEGYTYQELNTISDETIDARVKEVLDEMAG